MFFAFAIAITFLIKIRYGKNRNPIDILRQRYDGNAVQIFRKYEKFRKKLRKSELDFDFLQSCKAYGIIPKFLKFKLYDPRLHRTEMYNDMQNALLEREISVKIRQMEDNKEKCAAAKNELRSMLSVLDFHWFSLKVESGIDKYASEVKRIHEKKLTVLGAHLKLASVDPNKCIFNYSSYQLSEREKYLLSFGLDFALPVIKPNYFKYFIGVERLVKILEQYQHHQIYTRNMFIGQLKQVAFHHYHARKNFNNPSPIFSKDDIQILKRLGANSNLIILKPDKSRGVVIMDRNQYKQKMQQILQDESKFRKIENPNIYKICQSAEDKINSFLRDLKKLGKIDASQYNQMYTNNAAPGILYGLAKVHKPNTPLRPVLAAYEMASYNVAKFLVPHLDPYTHNEYSIKNSYSFQQSVSELSFSHPVHIVSYDVSSLYTQIPINECIEKIVELIYNNDSFMNFSRAQFKDFLALTSKYVSFLFNGNLYEQIDGLAMGSPIAPALANIFLNLLETDFLNNCPLEFKPIFYRRYLDDTFVIFHDETQADQFLQYINNQHNNIKFTIEKERNNRLPFLDLLISKSNNNTNYNFNTSVYRKPTYTDLGTSFFSSCCYKYKINAIKTLLHRAQKLSSNYALLCSEILYLRRYFDSNGYPKFIVNSVFSRFLKQMFTTPIKPITVPRKLIYLSFPYFGTQSRKLEKDLTNLVAKYFPQIRLQIAFKNTFKISSLVSRWKDPMPAMLQSNIIYEYQCGTCNSTYVGCSTRLAWVRFNEHLGISPRTGKPLSSPSHSPPRNHSRDANHPISIDQMRVIARTSHHLDLLILESLYITSLRPNLNNMNTSVKLNIIK